MTNGRNYLADAKAILADAQTAEPSNPTDDTALLVQIAQAHAEIAIAQELAKIRHALTAITETLAQMEIGSS